MPSVYGRASREAYRRRSLVWTTRPPSPQRPGLFRVRGEEP
jgi:hypothetical protein